MSLYYNKCINPITAVVTHIENGKEQLKFLPSIPVKGSQYYFNQQYQFGCGKCLYCMGTRNVEKSNRLIHESKLHKENCFITLTYNNQNLPAGNTLNKRDYQLFIKRLRKKVAPRKIRYFICGEYGEQFGRAHYHLILFGYVPKDLVVIYQDNKETLYHSKEIEKIWNKGYIHIGIDIRKETVKYVANYMGKLSDYNIETQIAPFTQASTNPGIGGNYIATIIKENGKNVITHFDKSIYETDSIYIEGKQHKIPKYYDKLAEKYGIDLEQIKTKRKEKYSKQQLEITLGEKKQYERLLISQKGNINHLFKSSNKKQKELIAEFGDHWVKVEQGNINYNKKIWLKNK